MKKDIDVEQVKDILKTKTLKQAALHLSVTYHALYTFCKKNNLKSQVVCKRGKKNESEKYIDDVIKCYLEGMSQAQIAQKLGVSQPTVAALIKKGAHHLRTRSEAARLRDSQKDADQLKQQAAAANAVRHAMGILNLFHY